MPDTRPRSARCAVSCLFRAPLIGRLLVNHSPCAYACNVMSFLYGLYGFKGAPPAATPDWPGPATRAAHYADAP
jgi:hypothetical protein